MFLQKTKSVLSNFIQFHMTKNHFVADLPIKYLKSGCFVFSAVAEPQFLYARHVPIQRTRGDVIGAIGGVASRHVPLLDDEIRLVRVHVKGRSALASV